METQEKKGNNYWKFFAMIGTSMFVMFFLMYLNSYQIIDHFWFSETRLYMTLIMGGAMIVIMLLFMIKMYTNSKTNTAIIIGGILLLAASVWLVRSQVTVSDVDYMEGMIPHHSIAILTSENAMIEDVRVRELADEIIKAQRREIKEMEWLIKDIRNNGLVKTKAESRSVPEFAGTPEQENSKYNPPKPEDAPKEIREVVLYGYDILTNTKKHLPDYVGNELNCHNCHFEGGITEGGKNGGISYVGVAAKYPKYRNRQDFSVDLMTRVNNCLMRSLNGDPLPPESKEMTAIITYFHWISKGVPIYAEIPWLGLKPLKSNHKPDKVNGQELYAGICAKCHGDNGEGGEHKEKMKKETNGEKGKMEHDESGPPLWGEKSFSDGAGMSKLGNMASFAYYNMPRHNPVLTEEQALDIAAWVTDQPRPKFEKDDNPW